MRWENSGGGVSGGNYSDLLAIFYIMFGVGGAAVGGIIAAIWYRTKKGFLMWMGIGAVVGAILFPVLFA